MPAGVHARPLCRRGLPQAREQEFLRWEILHQLADLLAFDTNKKDRRKKKLVLHRASGDGKLKPKEGQVKRSVAQPKQKLAPTTSKAEQARLDAACGLRDMDGMALFASLGVLAHVVVVACGLGEQWASRCACGRGLVRGTGVRVQLHAPW